MKKSILQKILAFLARATVRKHKPIIIGITGSVGKTSTREAIFAVLKNKYRVRTSEKNYNNEIGLPLTILGIPHYGRNIFAWLLAFIKVFFNLLFRPSKYPKIFVLEYGVDRPGDMDYLLAIAKPHIAVVTAIGEVPVHVEFFKDPEELIAEKTKLVRALPSDGWAVLNHDDYAVYDMNPVRSKPRRDVGAAVVPSAGRTSNGVKDKVEPKVLTFGFEEHAEIKIINYQPSIIKDAELGDVPEGISFKIEHGGQVVPFWIKGALGKPQAYAAATAAGVGLTIGEVMEGMNPVRSQTPEASADAPAHRTSNGMNLVEISEAIRHYTPPAGRMRLIPGIKKSFILDDTYNAAPEAMHAAVDTLETLPGKRKIAVLGDMLEIGKFSEQVHRVIGDRVAEFADILVTVGPRAKFIADEAKTRGIEKKAQALSREQVMSFDNSLEAGKVLDPLIQPGDLILVKGSQSMRMEKVVEEIMAHPERAAELLVRQDKDWENK